MASQTIAIGRCLTVQFFPPQLLAKENVIPEFPGSGQDLWRTGLRFVQKMTGATGFTEGNKSVFTCDTFGNEISSEIGPL